jgi:tetratricopeptide (TPR) repeat protein
MSYLFNLPVELYILLNDLPDEIITKINLSSFEVKESNFKQLCLSIIHHLKKISREDLSPETVNKLLEILLILCILAKEFSIGAELTIEKPTLKLLILNWNCSISINQPYKYDISSFKVDSEPEKIILEIFINLINISGDSKDWIPGILKIINEYPNYIHSNIIFFTLWLRLLSIPLSYIPENAIPIFELFLDLGEKIQSRYLLAIFFHSLAMCNYNKSQASLALENYQKSISHSEKIEIEMQMASKNNIGLIYKDLGEFDKAEEIYRELLEHKEIDTYKLNLADILLQKEQFKEALNLIEPLVTENNDFLNYGRILHEIYIKQNEFDKAESIEINSEKILKKNNIFINQVEYNNMLALRNHKLGNYSIAKELYQKSLEIHKARSNLRGIFQSHIRSLQVQLDLYTLKSDNFEMKNNIFSSVNSLIQLTDEQGMVQASIEGLNLRGDLLIKEEFFEDAKNDYYNAMKLAEKFEFDSLFLKSKEKLDFANSIINKGKISEEEKTGIMSKIKSMTSRLLNLNAKQVYQEKLGEVHGVIIIAPGGFNIFNKYITDRLTSEPELISGLISAVSSFMSEIAQGKGFLKSIRHDDLSVILEPFDNFIAVCITSEETFSIRDKTRIFTNKTKQLMYQYNNQISRGDLPDVLIDELNSIAEKIYSST